MTKSQGNNAPLAGHCVIYGVESWNGVMELSFGVDFGVEWSQIVSFCHPSRTGFYD